MKLLSFGEVLWDVFEGEAYLGGAPLNFAAFSAILGAEAKLLSAVGDDELGRRALHHIKALSVGTEYVSVLRDKATGRCLVTLDASALPTYNLLDDVAYDYIEPPQVCEEASVLAFGTLALRHEHNRQTLKKLLKAHRFSEVFVDLNVRPPFSTHESIRLALSYATILKFSDEEMAFAAEALGETGDDPQVIAARFCHHFPRIKLVLVTAGANGSFCYTSSTHEFIHCDAKKTAVISTVGAGDSFGASFLCEYMKKKPISHCLDFAATVSAIVCAHKEAVPADIGKKIGQLH